MHCATLHWILYQQKKKATSKDATGKLTKLEHEIKNRMKSTVLMINFGGTWFSQESIQLLILGVVSLNPTLGVSTQLKFFLLKKRSLGVPGWLGG